MCKDNAVSLHCKLLKFFLSANFGHRRAGNQITGSIPICAQTHLLRVAARRSASRPAARPLFKFAKRLAHRRIPDIFRFCGSPGGFRRIQMAAFLMWRNAERLGGFKARTRRESCRLAAFAAILAVVLLLAPLRAQADTFTFPSSGTVTGAPGTFGGGLPSQNVVPFADFASFSVDGFTFTGIYAGPPPGFCFSGSTGSNCVGPDLYLVGNAAQTLPPASTIITSGSYLDIPSLNDKSGLFGYSQVVVITNDAGTAFSLQSFNGSQILPPHPVAGFHQNAGSVFWQASL